MSKKYLSKDSSLIYEHVMKDLTLTVFDNIYRDLMDIERKMHPSIDGSVDQIDYDLRVPSHKTSFSQDELAHNIKKIYDSIPARDKVSHYSEAKSDLYFAAFMKGAYDALDDAFPESVSFPYRILNTERLNSPGEVLNEFSERFRQKGKYFVEKILKNRKARSDSDNSDETLKDLYLLYTNAWKIIVAEEKTILAEKEKIKRPTSEDFSNWLDRTSPGAEGWDG